MELLLIISGIVFIGAIGYGIYRLFVHAYDAYGYNIFNWINLLMGILILVVLVIMMVILGNEEMSEANMGLNMLVGLFIIIGLMITMFVRNVKHTSVLVGLGAFALQLCAVLIIIFIILALLSRRRE